MNYFEYMANYLKSGGSGGGGGWLPVVDFDALGLTTTVLTLFAQNGGNIFLYHGDSFDAEAVLNAIPSNGAYIAKITIPDMGVMCINPVYTLFNDGRLVVAHFDSYLMSSGAMTKFYVRIENGEEGVGLAIRVGFYA